jgi:hypothetical protein
VGRGQTLIHTSRGGEASLGAADSRNRRQAAAAAPETDTARRYVDEATGPDESGAVEAVNACSRHRRSSASNTDSSSTAVGTVSC